MTLTVRLRRRRVVSQPLVSRQRSCKALFKGEAIRNRWRKACWLVGKCGGMSEAEMPTIVSSSYARRVRALLLVWSAFQAAEANLAGI